MALFHELLATIILLVTRPFSLFILGCKLCVKTIIFCFNTWVELLRLPIAWAVAAISLPLRVFTALRRERQLELYLHEIQIEVENLIWERKELGGHLQKAVKECRLMESLLTELEEEHEKAIVKIELLEGELHDLKHESLRFKENQSKGYCDVKLQDDLGKIQNTSMLEKLGTSHENPSFKHAYDGDRITHQYLTDGETSEEETKIKDEKLGFTGASPTPKSIGSTMSFRPYPEMQVLEESRGVALSQSLFSAVLSLVVGLIVWEAEDPCMPLVVALFTVVGMSLKSVVQFFSTIKNKPASDAVALLSFNWFILGTLTYPTLPRVAHMLAPLGLSIVDQVLSWLRISSY